MDNDMMYDKICCAVDIAFADVEADFPDAECGWEVDIARGVIRDLILDAAVTLSAGRDYMRRQFGAPLNF